jgi:lipid II isoglutaminyl synthase (glutamine-hydrolysing)
MQVPLTAAASLARGVGALSRRRGGGGTSAPGKVLLALAPQAITALGSRLGRGTVLISATNGKTTTAAMSSAILERGGVRLLHNRAGANMAGGIATTLLDVGRDAPETLGLFEVDEMWLPRLASELRPRAIVLCNLFRDQLDRYGELEAIADSWADLIAGTEARLVLNADDPLLADLGRDGPETLYFGVEDAALAQPGLGHAVDARHCRSCGSPYVFDAVYLGHLGDYHCPGCGSARPTPSVTAGAVRLDGVRAASFELTVAGARREVHLSVPGLYNVYNALAAAALATVLGEPLVTVAEGLESTAAAFGRAEKVSVAIDRERRRETRILLIKNPAGANEVLRTLALEPGEHDVLAVLNDRIADGRDVSWIWDADFEALAGRLRRVTCSGTRAAEMATRFKYAGIDPARIELQPELSSALAAAAADRPNGSSPLFALPTYTAMLELRDLLVARGEAPSSWR